MGRDVVAQFHQPIDDRCSAVCQRPFARAGRIDHWLRAIMYWSMASANAECPPLAGAAYPPRSDATRQRGSASKPRVGLAPPSGCTGHPSMAGSRQPRPPRPRRSRQSDVPLMSPFSGIGTLLSSLGARCSVEKLRLNRSKLNLVKKLVGCGRVGIPAAAWAVPRVCGTAICRPDGA